MTKNTKIVDTERNKEITTKVCFMYFQHQKVNIIIIINGNKRKKTKKKTKKNKQKVECVRKKTCTIFRC